MAFTKTAGVEYGTPAVVLSTTAASGSNQTAIRTDGQIIAFNTDDPSPVGAAASVGTSAQASRQDHIHLGALTTQIIVSSRTAAAGSGDQAITGAGFTPTSALCISYDNDDLTAGWGLIDDDGDEYVIYTRSAAAGYTYNPHLIQIGPNGSNTMQAVWKSFDADGLTLTWTKTGSPPTADFVLLLMR